MWEMLKEKGGVAHTHPLPDPFWGVGPDNRGIDDVGFLLTRLRDGRGWGWW